MVSEEEIKRKLQSNIENTKKTRPVKTDLSQHMMEFVIGLIVVGVFLAIFIAYLGE
jgi:hypothetical protein